MKNLKNEGDSPLILQRDPRRITPKPLETRQIPLDSPCAKCGESRGKLGAGRQPRESSLHCGKCGSFVRWVSASEVNRLHKRTPVKGTPVKGTPVKGTPVKGTPHEVNRIQNGDLCKPLTSTGGEGGWDSSLDSDAQPQCWQELESLLDSLCKRSEVKKNILVGGDSLVSGGLVSDRFRLTVSFLGGVNHE